jgi:ATP-binding cassette, subfamily B, multidrug efflux pump
MRLRSLELWRRWSNMGFRGGGSGYHGFRVGDEDTRAGNASDLELAIRMFRYVLSYRKRLAIMSIAVISTTLLNLIPPLLYGAALDTYIPNLNVSGLILIAVGYLIVIALSFVGQYAQNYMIAWLFGKMEYDLRSDIFDHLQIISLRYFIDQDVGNVVSRATNDVDKISELVSSGIVTGVADLLTLVGIILVMFELDLSLTLISFSMIPLMLIWLVIWGKRVRVVYRETRKTIASVSAQMEESVSGIKEIQSFSKEEDTRKTFERINETNMNANVEAGRVMSAFYPTVAFFSALGQSLVLWFGGTSVIKGILTVGTLFVFMSYITRFFQPIQELSNIWNSVQSAMAAAERVFNIIDTPVEVSDADNAVELSAIQGRVAYNHMYFGYQKDHPVLKDIDLVIEPNTTVAFVGPTGVGKTTMINLLYRFYDPTDGSITVDGVDLRDIKIESLRHQMSVVLQDPFLFSGTVISNIRYSRPSASYDEVVEVSKAVGAHDFITQLPDVYDTDVMERGSRLSVGQRQLISLARALLTNPRILIMDEATSSIDAYTELLIQKAVNKTLKGRTAIIIAHRLSTVRNADLIVVLEEGRIAEIGRHDELIQRGGLYKKLYTLQFNAEPSVEMNPQNA